MTLICSACPAQLQGPASLDGDRCPTCGDGTLGVIDERRFYGLLERAGWGETS